MSYIGNEPIVSATRTITEITATAGQTVFVANGGYTVGYIDVFVNGAQLQTSDFTATNGSSITLNSGATTGDDIRLVAWGTFSTANALQKTANLSDLNNASTARTNLGLAIGTNVLAPNGSGASLTGLTGAQGSSLVFLGSATASNSASIDFTGLVPGNFSAYKLIVDCAVPVTNAVNLLLRVSSGGVFQTSGYTWQIWRWTTAGQAVNGQVDAGTGIALDAAGADNIANTANRGGSWVIDILCPSQGSDLHRVIYQGQYFGSTHLGISGAGYTGTNTIDGIRLLMDSGNISTGRFFLYGIKNA